MWAVVVLEIVVGISTPESEVSPVKAPETPASRTRWAEVAATVTVAALMRLILLAVESTMALALLTMVVTIDRPPTATLPDAAMPPPRLSTSMSLSAVTRSPPVVVRVTPAPALALALATEVMMPRMPPAAFSRPAARLAAKMSIDWPDFASMTMDDERVTRTPSPIQAVTVEVSTTMPDDRPKPLAPPATPPRMDFEVVSLWALSSRAPARSIAVRSPIRASVRLTMT